MTEEERRVIGLSAPHRSIPQPTRKLSQASTLCRLRDAIEGRMNCEEKAIKPHTSRHSSNSRPGRVSIVIIGHIYRGRSKNHRTTLDHVPRGSYRPPRISPTGGQTQRSGQHKGTTAKHWTLRGSTRNPNRSAAHFLASLTVPLSIVVGCFLACGLANQLRVRVLCRDGN